MVTALEIENPVKLRKAGMKALDDALGRDGAKAFLKQCRGIPGWDFAKWLKEQPEQSNEEIIADIMRSQELDEPMAAKLEGGA